MRALAKRCYDDVARPGQRLEIVQPVRRLVLATLLDRLSNRRANNCWATRPTLEFKIKKKIEIDENQNVFGIFNYFPTFQLATYKFSLFFTNIFL